MISTIYYQILPRSKYQGYAIQLCVSTFIDEICFLLRSFRRNI